MFKVRVCKLPKNYECKYSCCPVWKGGVRPGPVPQDSSCFTLETRNRQFSQFSFSQWNQQVSSGELLRDSSASEGKTAGGTRQRLKGTYQSGQRWLARRLLPREPGIYSPRLQLPLMSSGDPGTHQSSLKGQGLDPRL